MNRSFSFAFAAFCAAGLSFAASAETWTWIGGSTWGWGTPASGGSKKVIDLGSVEKANGLRDWTDGYNWQDSQGIRGDHPGEGAHAPQHGDVIVFDTDGKNEYTHCYGGGSGIDYGGILFKGSKAWSGYFGSQPVVKDGFVSNAIPQNVNLAYVMGAGTVELYCCSGGSLQFQLLKKSGASAASYVKTGPGTFRWQENGTSAYSTFDLSEGTVLLRNADLLDGGTTKFLMSGPQTELDLNGFSQNLKCALEQTSAETKITSSSGTPVLLLSGNNDDTEIKGKISGSVSICWNPNDSTKTLTLSGGVCDTTGTLIASNGVIAIAADTTFAAAGFDLEGGRLSVAGSSVVTFASGIVNGVPVESGYYTGTGMRGKRVDWLDATCVVMVGSGGEPGETVEASWNGTGEMSVLANWQGAAELPPLAEGSVLMKVEGGTSATVDRPYWIRGIDISAAVKSFSLTGTTPIWLGSLGIVAEEGAHGAYSLSCPVEAAIAQSWKIGGGNTLDVNAPLSGGASIDIDNRSATVTFNASSSDYAGNMTVTSGTVFVKADNALGGPVGTTFITNATPKFYGTIQSRNLLLSGAANFETKTTNVFNGAVESLSSAAIDANGGKVVFAGGLTTPGVSEFTWKGGCIVITNKIVNAKNGGRINLTGGEIHFFTSYNVLNSGQQAWISGSDTKIYTHVPYALNGGMFGLACNRAGGSTIDLCGCDQHFSSLQCGRGNNVTSGLSMGEYWKKSTQPGYIRSDAPALVHVSDSSNRTNPSSSHSPSSTNWAYFVGQAGISKDGSYKGLWLNQECMSSGTVQVTNQKLYFSKKFVDAQGNDYGTGSWPNAAKAIAKGSGTLVFEHSKAIGKKTDVIIEESGKVQLDADVNQRCADLYFGDEKQELGTWGSLESAAMHKDARFTGTGVLTVRGQHPGLLLLFR